MRELYRQKFRAVLGEKIPLVRKEFEIIGQPFLWFFIKDLNEINFKFEHYTWLLREHNLPFVCIVNQEGSYFLDLTSHYHRAKLDDIDIYRTYKAVAFKRFWFVYNYNIFWAKQIDMCKWASIYDSDLKKMELELGLDYIVSVSAIISTPSFTSFNFKIAPRGFHLKGIYLTHRIYDEDDKITLGFARRVVEAVLKLRDNMNTSIGLFKGDSIETKTELVDLLEDNVKFYLQKFHSIAYRSTGQENADERLERIEKILK